MREPSTFWSGPAAAWLALLVASSSLLSGCGWVSKALGMRNDRLLQGQDVLSLPGEKAVLRIRLESGSFLRDQEGREVRFVLDGKTLATGVTDEEGFAETVFEPPSPGDYSFRIEVPVASEADSWPEVDLLVSCRPGDAPIAVVDLDGTLLPRDFKEVLTGDPQPLDQACEVLKELARNCTIVYLTHRPECFGPKSKSWLARHGFPRGPMLLSDLSAFVHGNREYKSEALHRLRSRFSAMTIGIGDKFSDMSAYRQNGLRAILIFHLHDPDDAEDVREQAERLDKLPEGVQVVKDWAEVRAVLREGKKYPPRRMKDELLKHAANLKPRWRLW